MSRPNFIEWKPSARVLARQRFGDESETLVQIKTLQIEISRAELTLEFDLLAKGSR